MTKEEELKKYLADFEVTPGAGVLCAAPTALLINKSPKGQRIDILWRYLHFYTFWEGYENQLIKTFKKTFGIKQLPFSAKLLERIEVYNVREHNRNCMKFRLRATHD